MIERFIPRSLPPEIIHTRRWLEQEVIAKGTCPPLNRVVQSHRREDGSLDWDGMSEIDITSFRHLPLNSRSLRLGVAQHYLKFMQDSVTDKAPLTTIMVLSDFDTNRQYDQFVQELSMNALLAMYTNPTWAEVGKEAFVREAALLDIPKDEVQEVLSQPMAISSNVVQDVFPPIPFFGQELTPSDISLFAQDRGPSERMKMLSRAPHYLIQVLNKFNTEPFIGSLNRDRLRKRNTDLALGTDLQKYQGVMRDLRG